MYDEIVAALPSFNLSDSMEITALLAHAHNRTVSLYSGQVGQTTMDTSSIRQSLAEVLSALNTVTLSTLSEVGFAVWVLFIGHLTHFLSACPFPKVVRMQ